METLNTFKVYAISKGYEVISGFDYLTIKNVVNPGNDFKLMKINDYYAIITVRVSKQDYEYTAKCMLYVLLAEYNKDNSKSTHRHINYRVEL